VRYEGASERAEGRQSRADTSVRIRRPVRRALWSLAIMASSFAPLDLTRRQRDRILAAIRTSVVVEHDVGDWTEGTKFFVVECAGMDPWLVCI
jgi:hypothetical protein